MLARKVNLCLFLRPQVSPCKHIWYWGTSVFPFSLSELSKEMIILCVYMPSCAFIVTIHLKIRSFFFLNMRLPSSNASNEKLIFCLRSYCDFFFLTRSLVNHLKIAPYLLGRLLYE